MRVAALYDIHANLPALEAVMDDIARETVDVIVIGGDVVWGAMPRETMELLLALDVDVRFLMGNADRDVFDRVPGTWFASNDWCANHLSDVQLDLLRSAPKTISLDDVLYCHGSPRSDLDPITVGTSEERIIEWCEGVSERVIVCGHTHGQFDRRVRDLRIVNAGSVGDPFGDPGAYWAVIDGDVELRFTSYDVHAAASLIDATGFPNAPTLSAQIVATSTPEDASRMFDSKDRRPRR